MFDTALGQIAPALRNVCDTINPDTLSFLFHSRGPVREIVPATVAFRLSTVAPVDKCLAV